MMLLFMKHIDYYLLKIIDDTALDLMLYHQFILLRTTEDISMKNSYGKLLYIVFITISRFIYDVYYSRMTL